MLAVERAGRTVVVTLCRPPVNALNGELIAHLDVVMDQVIADPEVRCFIFAASKGFFAPARTWH